MDQQVIEPAELTLRDADRLHHRLVTLARQRDPARRRELSSRLDVDVEKARAKYAARLAGVPVISYPPALPVSERREDIAAAIRASQVVIVAGETGSGKTTQLPKICLELGRGVRGAIGHTQPRRIAARSVAERISEELNVPLGDAVGYQVRFTDRASDRTLVKVMTDGILLAEVQGDRDLLAYDTLIIDEAHERSLTIDFLLGYLTTLLPRRPDLKVIITSATIDVERFSAHFGGAPIVRVSGRTYPVEVRYRPLVDPEDARKEDRDQLQGVLDAVRELSRDGPGDILVFLSGEREIRDTAEALKGSDAEIRPLYGRLTAAEQHRVFERGSGSRRRIVLATNVAETSLTVPGIRYVIDPGTARISRSNRRTGVLRLPIEAISQASANQRSGRCGRVANGICIRLYSEEDYESRPAATDPEVLRTNLASVILRMAALRLGDISTFPFLDPPDRRAIRDGVRLLEELRALDADGNLTRDGRKMAGLPIDPRFARMVLEADRLGCLSEVLILVAVLSIQDPRERPSDKPELAAEYHSRFNDERSDFSSYLSLWTYIREQQRELSSSAFRRLCRRELLSWLRIREWQDLHGQLRSIARDLGIQAPEDAPTADPTGASPASLPEGAGAPELHQALMSGLLSQIGVREGETRDYQGARGSRFALAGGSPVAKRSPRWVVAGELVETTRLFARTVASIDPLWIEPVAAHVVVRTHSEPRWSRRRGAAVATEKVTLFGLPIVTSRTVDLEKYDPAVARELFIRHALVLGEMPGQQRFLAANAQVLAAAEDSEGRQRRRGIRPDEWALQELYSSRIPTEVLGVRDFEGWWRNARRESPDLLTLPSIADAAARDYPATWLLGDTEVPLSYVFSPGEPEDGVTATIPLPLLAHAAPLVWQVPGRRVELITALLKALPRDIRRSVGPAPNAAVDIVASIGPGDGELTDVLTREVSRRTGQPVARDAWSIDGVPDHVRMRFRVVDDERVLGEGRDLEVLNASLRAELAGAVRSAGRSLERTGLTDWPGGELPREISVVTAGLRVAGYPCLVDEGSGVGIRVLADPALARREMLAGTNRLLRMTLPPTVRPVESRLSTTQKLALAFRPHRDLAELLEDCRSAAVGGLIAAHGGPAWDDAGWQKLQGAVKSELVDATADVVIRVAAVLGRAREISDRLDAVRVTTAQPAVADIRAQLSGLIFPGFVSATGAHRLGDLDRYLRAALVRVQRLDARDAERQRAIDRVQAERLALLHKLPPGVDPEVVDDLRWMIEELRVSTFAQNLGTPRPISEDRILRAIDAIAG